MTAVETTYGNVSGTQSDGLSVFRNIPYAAAPVGDQRWLPPQPPKPWSGTREADEFGPISWQVIAEEQGPLSFAADAAPPQLNEDCLSLNVWTPGTDDGSRPVMVWIHGGAFVSGSGSSPIYDGSILATRGNVVVVTINYRLGVLGFLNLNEITGGRIPATGNEGLLDQAFALQWVQDNIANFGGDPNNVTIFGESAGGMSVGALLGLPQAKGLFHRAIPQSGAAHTANTVHQASEVSARLLRALDISVNDNLQKLLQIEAEKLTQSAAEVSNELGRMIFQPCIDGVTLPERPIDAVAGGSADGLDVLVGSTRDEWLLFSAMDPRNSDLTHEGLEKRVSATNGRPDLSGVAEVYRSYLSTAGHEASPIEIWSAMETDRTFRMPGIKLAEAMASRGQNAYEYLFTVESPAFGGALKSCHAIDIGYVFGTHNANEGTRGFFGATPDHIELANAVMDAWLAFAHTGNSQTEALADWEAYDTQTRSTAIFGLPATVESAPRDELRAVWDDPSVSEAIGSF